MKGATIVLAVALAAGCGAHWSRRDALLEVGSLVVNMIDAHQSVAIAAAGLETNPLMGPHGERIPVVPCAVAMAILHVLVTDALPPSVRPAWQGASIGFESGAVVDNWRKGWTP